MPTEDQHNVDHRGHNIRANAIGYVVHDGSGSVIHTVVDKSHSAPLTNLQRGQMWVDNKIGIVDEDDESLEGKPETVDEVAVDSDQKVASVGE